MYPFKLRNMIIMGLLSALFGCGGGEGKPGLFSSMGYHVGKTKVWYKQSASGYEFYRVSEVVGADPGTFKVEILVSPDNPNDSLTYGLDKYGVFLYGSQIEAADPATFEYLGISYAKDKRAVYFLGQRISETPEQFSLFDRSFGKDSQHIYSGRSIISDDPEHFTKIGDENSVYYKDRERCWYGHREIEGAVAATFRLIDGQTAADAKQVYFKHEPIEGALPASFQPVSGDYYRDAKHIFYQTLLLEGADAASFREVSPEVFADKKGVFLRHVHILGADPATFEMLNDYYGRDAKRCYYSGIVLKGADPKSFQVLGDYYAKDARQVYYNDNLIAGADPASFRILNEISGCSCDAKYAYAWDERIKDVDPNQFPTDKECISCDESGVIFGQ